MISNLRNSWSRVVKDKLSWNFYDHKFAWEFLLFISTLFVLSFLLNRLIWYLHPKCTYILSTGREKGENHPVFFQGFTLFSLKCTSQRVVWKNCYYFFFSTIEITTLHTLITKFMLNFESKKCSPQIFNLADKLYFNNIFHLVDRLE